MICFAICIVLLTFLMVWVHYSLKSDILDIRSLLRAVNDEEEIENKYYQQCQLLLFTIQRSGDIIKTMDTLRWMYAGKEVSEEVYNDLMEQLEYRLENHKTK